MPLAFGRQNPAEQKVVLQPETDLLLGHNDPVVEGAAGAELLA